MARLRLGKPTAPFRCFCGPGLRAGLGRKNVAYLGSIVSPGTEQRFLAQMLLKTLPSRSSLPRRIGYPAMNGVGLVRWCTRRAVWGVLERFPIRPSLIVINYHRVGSPDATPFDSGVYTVTPQQLAEHADFLANHYDIVDLEGAIRAISARQSPRRGAVLITFDDGYRDNYDLALPILAGRGIPATFFLVSSFVGSSTLPWWDSVAYVIKHARRQHFTLKYPAATTVDLAAEPVSAAVRRVLYMYRTAPEMEHERFMAELEQACDQSRPVAADRQFLDWDEAAKLVAGGMTIGSHSHTHRLMGRLPVSEQLDEAVLSRQIIAAHLGAEPKSYAYPVGRLTAFTPASMDAVRRAGYQIAFSFCGGVNRAGQHAFDLRRLDAGVTPDIDSFRARLAVASSLGR